MTDIVPPEEQFYSPKKVAETFQVTQDTVHNWRRQGLLKGVKINGRWRIYRSSVIALANARHGSES